MTDIHADLRSYYEAEARRGTRTALGGRRVVLRDEFLSLLEDEGRASVLDFGAGPGLDGSAFVDAGLRFVGLDVAHGNAVLAAGRSVLAAGSSVLAAGRSVHVVQGSIATPPIRPRSFDAGWSMSTLMHIPEPEVPDVVEAMAQTLQPGAPLLVGLWGGGRGGDHIDSTIDGERRLFSRRSFDRNRDLIAAAGDIEREEVWPFDDEDYHVFLVRVSHDID